MPQCLKTAATFICNVLIFICLHPGILTNTGNSISELIPHRLTALIYTSSSSGPGPIYLSKVSRLASNFILGS
ncbi:hypothetical protein GGR53DRAFT_502521 [Hypoxylon sp. FL1150]|nr:hypothetical protein GGR53DRAFT_502521 [Hypoxylon sp. FL1150]